MEIPRLIGFDNASLHNIEFGPEGGKTCPAEEPTPRGYVGELRNMQHGISTYRLGRRSVMSLCHL
jgi:hypothetical protein